MIPRRSCSLFFLLFTALLGDGHAATTFTLAAVKTTGSATYATADVVAASGLQIGQKVTEEEFQKASQRLGESGAFSDVAYHYRYSGSGATLELELKDNPQLVPARFDNFVWFSDQELADKVHQRVPLFHGLLPLKGEMADQVSEALQSFLIERSIDGKAEYLRSGDLDTAIDAITFTVSGLRLEIRSVDFPGAAPSEVAALQPAAAKLKGLEYSRNTVRVHAEKDILPIYLQQGYLKTEVGDGQAKIVEKTQEKTLVDISLPVTRGPQYKFTKLKWLGNSILSAAQLDPFIHLETGNPANAIQLEKDLEDVQRLYGTRGYMAARIKTIPEMDDQNLTVAYELQVHEDEVYRMGDLEVRGVDNPTSRRLVLAWRLHEGDIYDASYAERYSKGPVQSIVSSEQWDLRVDQTVNDSDKTVDVTLKLEPKTQ